ncbi:MAG: 2-hydroxyglutaryl-CoA dehydratase [Planctomycetes bacterium]|jgi:predicted CoA-substrate-specific enzyme activase|nr:2-hydroxyglutaryl-CoA dehydratase [Planctomycetota bacterium]MCP4839140.1 2-hydroxyglutaryl-CoA dehydratase [Planctomycetota bacterium]
MNITIGIDIGSTYTKAIVLTEEGEVLATDAMHTGFKLDKVSTAVWEACIEKAGLTREDISYTVATGIGRHRCVVKDIHVTDLTASARGAIKLFPGTRTILDVGGQTMKAIRVEESGKVKSFRLNDKCAAGTGAFLEKTARYMGYETAEIGPLLNTAKEPAEISGVCAVFAESEVINQLSLGTPPSDIMQGAIESLVTRCVQLMKRVKAEPEFTLIGGIMHFSTVPGEVMRQLDHGVNVPEGEMCMFTTALGAAVLGHRRLEKLAEERAAVAAG